MLSAESVREAIVEYSGRLAGSAVVAGAGAAVPTAPEWTVADLVEHVGQTQHWVAEIIERRIVDPTQLPTEMAVVPSDPAEWQAWLAESAQRVADACSDEALVAPVFNAAGDERSGAQFWMTSMLNESVIHGFDAANAANTAGGADAADGVGAAHAADVAGRRVRADVDADVAVELIGNHLAMLTSPTWAMRRAESAGALRGTGQTLQWLATDTARDEGAWFIERRPDGAIWRSGIHQADVTITGPAGSLLLIMTRRVALTDHEAVSIDGDADLAQHWLDNTAHVAG
jgi:uncharacterized protein (TIGR03083 family)